jgi:hypothetical protein
MSARSDRRRLLDKLLRELMRCENQAREHAPREARRIGETPPVAALREVALHAVMMRPRLTSVLEAHEVPVAPPPTTASALRQLVADHMYDAERAFRAALLDLRHGIDVVRVLREVTRLEELFGGHSLVRRLAGRAAHAGRARRSTASVVRGAAGG